MLYFFPANTPRFCRMGAACSMPMADGRDVATTTIAAAAVAAAIVRSKIIPATSLG